jgi:hypothetical protein
LASDLFGLDISLGMISKLERRAAEVLEPVVAEVAAAIVAAPSAHIDETSWSEADEKVWLWVGQTDDLTVFKIADNRSGPLDPGNRPDESRHQRSIIQLRLDRTPSVLLVTPPP